MSVRRIAVALVGVMIAMPIFGQATSGANVTKPTDAQSGQLAEIAPPLHPATEQQIREYMSLNGMERTVKAVMSKTVEAMRATAAPYVPASVWEDMNNEFQKVDFVSICVPIYQKYLSQEDMAAIIAFYRSPAGQRILATQGPITRDAQVVMQKAGQEIGERVAERHAAEIEAAEKKYDADIVNAADGKK